MVANEAHDISIKLLMSRNTKLTRRSYLFSERKRMNSKASFSLELLIIITLNTFHKRALCYCSLINRLFLPVSLV